MLLNQNKACIFCTHWCCDKKDWLPPLHDLPSVMLLEIFCLPLCFANQTSSRLKYQTNYLLLAFGKGCLESLILDVHKRMESSVCIWLLNCYLLHLSGHVHLSISFWLFHATAYHFVQLNYFPFAQLSIHWIPDEGI